MRKSLKSSTLLKKDVDNVKIGRDFDFERRARNIMLFHRLNEKLERIMLFQK